MHHAIRVDPCDTEGVERLCRYLVHPLTGEASVTLDPLEMLAQLCQHIPPPGVHLARLYGTYANRTRGARARRMSGVGKKPASPRSEADTPAPTQRERRRQWARLIAKVFEVDPLRCPCGGTMGVIAFILDPAVIWKILQHRPRPEPRAHPRPARWGVPPDDRARREPVNLGGSDQRSRRPLRTASVARGVIEFPTLERRRRFRRWAGSRSLVGFRWSRFHPALCREGASRCRSK